MALSRWPSGVLGLWIPGVSTNTTWASGRSSTPRTRVRVVWGLSETIDTLVPRMRLSSVDFPTLGRPTIVQKPDRISARSASGDWSKAWSSVDADAPDAAAVHALGDEAVPVDVDGLALDGHVAELGKRNPPMES